MHLTITSNKTLVFLILYLSLIVGFYFNENTSGGAYPDFKMRMFLIENFKNDFFYTFLNYNNYEDRHSPILLIILSSLYKFGINLDLIRFIHLNFLILLIFISFKCLELKFPKENKDIIFIICCAFFLSPSLRSIAIWPDSRMLGLIVFLFSVFYFLNFKKTQKFKDCILSSALLIISSYISPNFIIFFLYFFYFYIQILKFSKKLFIIVIINLVLSLPMIFYLFVLDVNFLTTKAIGNTDIFESLNISNKIFIISSLLFFYMLPFIPGHYSLKYFSENFKIKYLYLLLIFYSFFIYYFNYSINYTGGGIFFKLSYFFFNNSYFFFAITFVSLICILSILKLNINNFLLFIVLILSNPQLTIYHKYFDPMLVILFFLFFDFRIQKNKFIRNKFVVNLYIFYTGLLFLNIGRYYI